jgi:DNA-binding NarL/FixJ family response regulator
VRVVIAEDSVLLREGLIRLLDDAGMEVVAPVSDGEALLRAVGEHDPQLCVVDVRMPPTHNRRGTAGRAGDPQPLAGVAVLVLSQ